MIQPITAEWPCGENLEDTALLASFDAFRLFGHAAPPDPPPDWNLVRSRAGEALARSKDLRLLAHLATAVLRTDGLLPFLDTIMVAAQWLDTYWDQVYPVVDEDLVTRRNALNCFADPIAVVDGLRRLPIVSSRQHGSFSLRDMDIAAGLQAPPKGEQIPDKSRIAAALADLSDDELVPLHERVSAALGSLHQIEAAMLQHGGPEAVPVFDALTTPLMRLERTLKSERGARGDGAPVTEPTDVAPEASAAAVPAAVQHGAIRTRQDAIRALEGVAEYFREFEPSSPVPLILERAKRLVSKNFLEVLEDIAPAALEQVRIVGGLNKD